MSDEQKTVLLPLTSTDMNVLQEFVDAVDHVTENGKTKRSVSSSRGWAMVHKDRLSDLEEAEEAHARIILTPEEREAIETAAMIYEQGARQMGHVEDGKRAATLRGLLERLG